MTSRYVPRIDRPGSGGGGPPPQIEDHFAPRFLVGNVPNGDPAVGQAAPFEYIPDTGDGSGIAAAVAAANAAGGGDIWIRPGTYDLSTGGVTGFVITAPRVTIRGAGFETIIRGRADARSVFDFSASFPAILQDIAISMPQAAAGAAGLQVVHCGFQGAFSNIQVTFDGPAVANPNESLTAVFRDTGTGRHRNLYSLVTPFTGTGQVAAFEMSGSFAFISQSWATLGDAVLRVSNQGHRVEQFYALLFGGGVEATGQNHILDMSLQSFIDDGTPIISVDASKNVSLRGMIENFGAQAPGAGVEVGATAVGTSVQMMTFDAVPTCVDILAGADRTTVLGCQLDGGVVVDAGTSTEQAHNQP